MVASHSDPAGFAALRARLHEINPRASMHDSVNGRIDTAILRCKTDDDAEAAFRDFSDWIAATADHCHEHDCHDPDHDHSHSHAHQHPHETGGITSFVIRLDKAVDQTAFNEFLQDLVIEFGDNLLRMKGILNVEGRPDQPGRHPRCPACDVSGDLAGSLAGRGTLDPVGLHHPRAGQQADPGPVRRPVHLSAPSVFKAQPTEISNTEPAPGTTTLPRHIESCGSRIGTTLSGQEAPMYANFDLLVPEKLDQAIGMIAKAKTANDVAPLGGGTNLVVEMRASGVGPATLVSVGQLAGLRGITIADGTVTIGAATTVSDILRDPRMKQVAAVLVESADVFAGQMIRNTATVAGNICCGSPAADLVPPLLALGASVTLRSGSGEPDSAAGRLFHRLQDLGPETGRVADRNFLAGSDGQIRKQLLQAGPPPG